MNGLTITELKVSRDARGWNTHPFDESALREGAFANIHMVSMEPGSIRGNHKHIIQTEQVLIVGGPVLFVALGEAAGERFEKIFQPGEQLLIAIAPGVAHVFHNIGSVTTYLLCASDLAFDPSNPDMSHVEIISNK
jgi:dTDP-4-dehydrorhamnose 3,5-epimerase-like enzyme